LGEKYQCVLVIDESHSIGTHGPNGRGMVFELGLTNRVHFVVASLAKAFVNRAGIIACSKEFAGYFPYVSRPAIFSSAMLPVDSAGLSATLEIIFEADDKRKRLHENANHLRQNLDQLGYNVSSSASQIIAIESGSEENTEILRDSLESRGVFGAVFCRPATPKNRSIIRLSVCASLTCLELKHIVQVFDEVKDETGMSSWKSTRIKNQLNHQI